MPLAPHFLLLFCLLGLPHAAATTLRGVHPDLLHSYSPSLKEFHCLDGSAKVPRAFVNDDYCDCVDGSDEPGTSACPRGSFYCANFGFLPRTLPSQFVDDGVCDCCDGSDELHSCNNTCSEAGREMREQLVARIGAVEQGLQTKTARLAEGQELKEKWQKEVVELEKKVERMRVEVERVRGLKEQEDQKAKALKDQEEQKAKLEKEEESGETLEEGSAANEDVGCGQTVGEEAGQSGFCTEGDVGADQGGILEEVEEPSVPADGGVQGSQEDVSHSGDDAAVLDPGSHEDYDQYDYYGIDGWEGGAEPDTIQEPPQPPPPPPGLLQRVSNLAMSIKKRIFPVSDVERKDSPQGEGKAKDESRSKELREAESRLRNMEKELTDLNEKISRDHGPGDAYLSLEGKCFEHSINKYTYEMCPFASAKQMEGSQSTGLGSWSGFDETSKWMTFAGGRHCWNGPNRSIRVGLSCGAVDELVEVTEPNVCEYLAVFKTPGACTEEELENLRLQLQQFVVEDNTKTEL